MEESDEFTDRGEADERIRRATGSLPDYDSPGFWADISERGQALPPEVLVRVLREFRARGRTADVERAADMLIPRAYAIAEPIIRNGLRSKTPEQREDAVADAISRLWTDVVTGNTFWERNFVGALSAACYSACRKQYAKKRSGPSFADMTHPQARDEWESGLHDSTAQRQQQAVLERLDYERVLETLDPPVREVWRLFHDEELSQKEIAQRLGCADKTVYNRLAKAREHLARHYEEET